MTITQIENPKIAEQQGKYITVTIDTARVLNSWKASMFSHEWLDQDGTIKPVDELNEREQKKCHVVMELLSQNQPLPMPVLGIGINDNIEIGMGRAEFLTLTAQGHTELQVHIPKSNEDEFQKFLIS